MSLIYDQVSALIQNSPTLTAKPEEQWFWQAQAKDMTDEQLQKLMQILTTEQASVQSIKATEEQNISKIDKDHLSALLNFKNVTLPKFRQEWEAQSREKENPEKILQSIDNANA